MRPNNTYYSYLCTHEKQTINDYSKSSCFIAIMAFVFAVTAHIGRTVETAAERVESVAVYPITNDADSDFLNCNDS